MSQQWPGAAQPGQSFRAKIDAMLDNICQDDPKQAFINDIWPALRDDYEAMRGILEQYCKDEIKRWQSTGIRCQVSSRTKTTGSIKKSLDRREQALQKHNGQQKFNSVRDILGEIHDLVGLRIILEFPDDMDKAISFIDTVFQKERDPIVFSGDRKVGKLWDTWFGAYQTRNYRVSLRSNSFSGSFEPISQFYGVLYEIQLTTLPEDLYNKLAYPLLYKSSSGMLTQQDEMIIDMSHGLSMCYGLCIRYMKDRLANSQDMSGSQRSDESSLKTATEDSQIIADVTRFAQSLTGQISGQATAALEGPPRECHSVSDLKEWLSQKLDEINCPQALRSRIEWEDMPLNQAEFGIPFSLSGINEAVHFVAREGELNSIHKALGKASGRRTAVVHGLGGMGKTQLAIAYAKRHQNDYSAIFWLNAKDETSLKQEFAKVAERILRRHPSVLYIRNAIESRDLNQAVQAVKRWLNHVKNDRWLVIYDSYDNPKLGGKEPDTESDRDANIAKDYDIRPFFPDTYHGAILITTRPSTVTLGQQIPLKKLADYKDSLAILSHSSNRQNLIEDAAAVQLAQKLDGLPLALTTAGAYLNNMAITFAEYLEIYEKSWFDLQRTTPQLYSYEDRALHTTWNLSYTQVEQQSPAAAKLLKLWAFFDNEDLWFELLYSGRLDGPQWFQELIENKISFVEAVRVLCSYGLVEKDMSKAGRSESYGYGIHSCVHSWTVHVLNEARDDDNMAKLAIRCLGSHVPNNEEREYWIVQRRLMQHAGYCLKMMLGGKSMAEGDEWCLVKIGDLFTDQGRLGEAEAMYQRALEGYEKALGPDHISTLDTVNRLSNLHIDQGRLGEAEARYQQALEGYKKALGPDHISTLDIINNLGNLHQDQGRLREAEATYQRALQGYEKAFGPDHISTLNTVNNLGILYKNQGRLGEAEAKYQRALEGYKHALGPDHISTLHTVNSLGNLYQEQGRLGEAEVMYQRALEGYEKALGTDHISTLHTFQNLGVLYKNQGRLGEAEAMYQRALEGYEKALGPDHVSTLNTVNSLGGLYTNQGRLGEAEAMYQRALEGREKALGPDHITTLSTVNNLGNLYIDQGRLREAETMYQRALLGFQTALGPSHSKSQLVMRNIESLRHAKDSSTITHLPKKESRIKALEKLKAKFHILFKPS